MSEFTPQPGTGTNGQPPEDHLSEVLQDELTVGYRPQTPTEAMWLANQVMPQLTIRRDIEFMLIHPIVSIAMEYYKSGISGAEFWGGPDHQNPDNERGKPISPDQRVSEFVLAHCERFWQRGVPLIQEGGYSYGWGSGEYIYKDVKGMLVWSHMKDFHPNDAHILTLDYQPVGVRVKNIKGKSYVDLHLGSESIPAKACWYPHRPRFNQFYGRSQLLGAWYPWRRLAWRDGTEQVIDAAVYRAGYCGPIVGHPQEDMPTSQQGVPATRVDGAGIARRSARDVAMQMIEYAKAGAGFTKPTAKYPQSQGGGDKWTIEFPEHVMDVGPLINEAKYLEDQIMLGIGVPPELVKASDTGSGYSGRSIPREAFLDGQQKVADAMLQMFVEQVLKPLVRWNFGDVPFEVSCKSLLKSQSEDKQGEGKEQGKGQGKQPGQQGQGGQRPPTPPSNQQPPKQPQPPTQQPPQSPAMSIESYNKVMDIARRVMARRVA